MSKEYHTFHIHSQFAQMLGHIRRGQLDPVTELLQTPTIAVQVLHLRDRNGRTALHHCADTLIPEPRVLESPLDPKARSNQLFEIAQFIIKSKPDLVESQDNEGNTPLHLAVINGNLALTKLLIRSMSRDQINIGDYELHTAVHWATVCGELECLAVVLDTGGAEVSTSDIYGAHPVHYATQSFTAGIGDLTSTYPGNNGIRGQSSFYGASLAQQKYGARRANGLRILHHLLSRQNVDVNCTDNEGRTPLLWAASSGNHDALLALVKAGAEISQQDKDGLSALHCASSRGHYKCAEILIMICGADVHQTDSSGCTPIFYATALGHSDCVRLLLESGGDVDHQDHKGRTAAHCGASKGQLETLKILHQHGANMWIKNVRGDLPLHEAIKSGRKDLVKWLLDLNPKSINDVNLYGRSALHIASFNNNVELCRLLVDHGADLNAVMKIRSQYLTPLDAAHQNASEEVAEFLKGRGAAPIAQIDARLAEYLQTTSPIKELGARKRRQAQQEAEMSGGEFDGGGGGGGPKPGNGEEYTKLPNIVHNNGNGNQNETRVHSRTALSTASSSIMDNNNHHTANNHAKLHNVREFETQLAHDKPTHLKQAIITNVYLTTTGGVPIGAPGAVQPVYYVKRVPPLKKGGHYQKGSTAGGVKTSGGVKRKSNATNGATQKTRSRSKDQANGSAASRVTSNTNITTDNDEDDEEEEEEVDAQTEVKTLATGTKPESRASVTLETHDTFQSQFETRDDKLLITQELTTEPEESSEKPKEPRRTSLKDAMEKVSERQKRGISDADQEKEKLKDQDDDEKLSKKPETDQIQQRAEVDQERENLPNVEQRIVSEDDSGFETEAAKKATTEHAQKQQKLENIEEDDAPGKFAKSRKDSTGSTESGPAEWLKSKMTSAIEETKEFVEESSEKVKKIFRKDSGDKEDEESDKKKVDADSRKDSVEKVDGVSRKDSLKKHDSVVRDFVQNVQSLDDEEDAEVAGEKVSKRHDSDSAHKPDSIAEEAEEDKTSQETRKKRSIQEDGEEEESVNQENPEPEVEKPDDDATKHRKLSKQSHASLHSTASVDSTKSDRKDSLKGSPDGSRKGSAESSRKASPEGLRKGSAESSRKGSAKSSRVGSAKSTRSAESVESEDRKVRKSESKEEEEEEEENASQKDQEEEDDATETSEKISGDQYDKSVLNNMIDEVSEKSKKSVEEEEEEEEETVVEPEEIPRKLSDRKDSRKPSKTLTQIDESSLEQEMDQDDLKGSRQKVVEAEVYPQPPKDDEEEKKDTQSYRQKESKAEEGEDEENDKSLKEVEEEEIVPQKVEVKSDDDFGRIKNKDQETDVDDESDEDKDKNVHKKPDTLEPEPLAGYRPIRKRSVSYETAAEVASLKEPEEPEIDAVEKTQMKLSGDEDKGKVSETESTQQPIRKLSRTKPEIENDKLDLPEADFDDDAASVSTFVQDESRRLVSESSQKILKPTPMRLSRTSGSKRYDHIGPKVDSYWNYSDYTGSKAALKGSKGTRGSKEMIAHGQTSSSGGEYAEQQYSKINPKIINQTVEKYLRKYYLERKLFEELYDLKRYQIRTGKSNEPQQVKRLVEKFRRDIRAPGMADFKGPFSYRAYEMFLYDQLRKLSRSNERKIAFLDKSMSYEDLNSSFEKSDSEFPHESSSSPTREGATRLGAGQRSRKPRATGPGTSKEDPLLDYDSSDGRPYGMSVDYRYEYHKSQQLDHSGTELIDVIRENLYKRTGMNGNKVDELAISRKVVERGSAGGGDEGTNENAQTEDEPEVEKKEEQDTKAHAPKPEPSQVCHSTTRPRPSSKAPVKVPSRGPKTSMATFLSRPTMRPSKRPPMVIPPVRRIQIPRDQIERRWRQYKQRNNDTQNSQNQQKSPKISLWYELNKDPWRGYYDNIDQLDRYLLYSAHGSTPTHAHNYRNQSPYYDHYYSRNTNSRNSDKRHRTHSEPEYS